MKVQATLLGDGIENPGNARTMIHAAEMYGAECVFRDTAGLAGTELGAEDPAFVTPDEIAARGSRLVAFDNAPGAKEIYGFAAGKEPLVAVGNERRGLSHTIRQMASDAVEIPMHSRRINCLNVAASSAVALHYLTRAKVGPIAQRKNVANHRPELLLLGAGNPVELGSAIRSATAFGWPRAFVEDREEVWFGCDRVVRSEGRGAARRGRNKIRLVPCPPDRRYQFVEVVVVTSNGRGKPLHKTRLARGTRLLIVLPDESRVDLDAEDWPRLGGNVQFVSLDVPASAFVYHYRLTATVAMAEVARQVGRRLPGVPRPRRRTPVYDRALDALLELEGEDVWLDELMDY